MPRNNADFNGIKYSHEDSGRLGARVVAEHPEHGDVGYLLLLGRRNNTSGRKIRDIYVKPEFRRQGIGTGM
jgi:GNAT superfamily N-acetyltransferase